MATISHLNKMFTILVLGIVFCSPVTSQSCNRYGFACDSATTFHDCVDNVTSGAPQTCLANTFCDSSCQTQCVGTVPCAAKCNAQGFYCVPEKPGIFQQCIDDIPTPDPQESQCAMNPTTNTTLICDMRCTLSCSEKQCPDCSKPGKYPVPGNIHSYYICSVDANNGTVFKEYTCPDGTNFDPVSNQCLTSTTTPTTTPTATPTTNTTTTPTATPTTNTTTTPTATVPAPFACSEVGKFPDPTNCKNYFICTTVTSGGFLRSGYVCPGTSAFDPTSRKCSNLVTCAPPPTTATTTTTTTTTTTLSPFVCPAASGKYADPNSCTNYFMCVGSVPYSYACSGSSLYDPIAKKCSLMYTCTK